MSALRPNEPPMPEPLAYFLTWTVYGTWLPGDERGWVRRGEGWKLPKPITKELAEDRMAESSFTLDDEQHIVVEATIREHCRIRGWDLYAVSCRTNHVHVVVAAPCHPTDARDQFKAWCTRQLKELRPADADRTKWWTRRGSQRFINDEESLGAAVLYVLEAQDSPRDR